VYVNYRQRALRARDGTLTLRTDAHAQLDSAIRETLRRVAPSVPFEISTARQRIGARMADRRFALYVISGFALIALGLAAIGIYGIVSWAVERRTREMGIRIALGAVPRGVAGRIVGEAMMVVTGGVILGLIAAVAATRLIAGMLVAVPATEPLTFTAVVLLLAGVAFLAAALPARRVTRIDPISALRTE
jgi:ABC-type antimicrobial peptide transport system permease subunit